MNLWLSQRGSVCRCFAVIFKQLLFVTNNNTDKRPNGSDFSISTSVCMGSQVRPWLDVDSRFVSKTGRDTGLTALSV